MLTEEQANAIKEQLLKQLDNFPEDQQDQVKNKILSMTVEEVEAFVKQNQLTHLEQQKSPVNATECIFCNIASKQIPSFPLDEDKDNLAVLEINPLSKGHSMIIPKKHLEAQQIPSTAFTMAKKIAKKIQSKFKPQEIKISTQKIMNHALIEILPLYGDEKERKKESLRRRIKTITRKIKDN
jgi:histidine triad (HIT) family protein